MVLSLQKQVYMGEFMGLNVSALLKFYLHHFIDLSFFCTKLLDLGY